MCWGVPGRVLEIRDGYIASIDFGGSIKEAIIGVDDLSPGEYVLVHAGVVISKITKEDILHNVGIYQELIYHQLLSMGYNEEEAREKSREEVRSIMEGLDIDISDIGDIEMTRSGEGKIGSELDKYNIPENAFRARYKISLSDTDYLQVMHYTNYYRYCERAQQELLESIGYSYSTLIHKYGIFIPTVESWGEFKAPVRLDNEIEVYVWVEEIGEKHIKWRYVIYNHTSQRVVGICYTTSVCTDTTLMEAIEIPEHLRENLEKYMG